MVVCGWGFGLAAPSAFGLSLLDWEGRGYYNKALENCFAHRTRRGLQRGGREGGETSSPSAGSLFVGRRAQTQMQKGAQMQKSRAEGSPRTCTVHLCTSRHRSFSFSYPGTSARSIDVQRGPKTWTTLLLRVVHVRCPCVRAATGQRWLQACWGPSLSHLRPQLSKIRAQLPNEHLSHTLPPRAILHSPAFSISRVHLP